MTGQMTERDVACFWWRCAAQQGSPHGTMAEFSRDIALMDAALDRAGLSRADIGVSAMDMCTVRGRVGWVPPTPYMEGVDTNERKPRERENGW